MKIRITGILLLCTVIVLSLPLSSCDQNSTASDLESVSDRPPSNAICRCTTMGNRSSGFCCRQRDHGWCW